MGSEAVHRRLPALGASLRRAPIAIGAAVVIGATLALLTHAGGVPAATVPAAPAGPGFRPTPAQRAGLTIEPVRVERGADETVATGVIAVDETRSTPVFLPYTGQVTRLLVDAGSNVARGQALLTVKTNDIVDARNALFAANAAHATATAAVRLAGDNAARAKQIFESAGGARKDYLQAQSDLVAAQSTFRSSRAAVAAARDKLAIYGKTPVEISRLEANDGAPGLHPETTLRAPIAGVVATRAVAVGQYVAAGGDKPALTIADPTHVWLVAQLAESDASHVAVGDRVEVTTSALPGRVFTARIDNVAAALDPVTHRLPVRASIANADRALKPQMFASFRIRGAARGGSDAVYVPAAAVIHEGDSARVWQALPNGLLVPRAVKVGDSRNGRVKIIGGLANDAKIVTTGAIFVNETGTP